MNNSTLYRFAKKCEYPGNSLCWNFMNFFFCQFMILYGLQLYKKIKRKFPGKRLIFMPVRSVGDIYAYYKYKNYMLDSLNINEDETIFICANDTEGACMALQLHYSSIPMSRLAALSMAQRYYGADRMDSLLNAYSWCLFDEEKIQNRDIQPHQPPALDDCREKLLKQLSDIGCVPGKTVVVAPYEKSLTSHQTCIPVSSFWEELAASLKEKGLSVCTNCKGSEEEPPIAGTKGIYPRLNECEELVTLAGASVILRSGFADITSRSHAAIIVLYPSEKAWNTWRISVNQDFPNHHEIIYKGAIEDKKYRRELINEIIELVQYEEIN